jgi:predicted DNA-binding antitoxin AbrB/MazE fold protein
MTETITAIYEGGVLRPTTVLPFADGTQLRLTVDAVSNGREANNAGGLPEEADQARRQEAAAFVQSLIDAKDRDELPEGYDFLEALNENRRLSGDYRMLFPPEEKGKTW